MQDKVDKRKREDEDGSDVRILGLQRSNDAFL
jgi:hypothetical protein